MIIYIYGMLAWFTKHHCVAIGPAGSAKAPSRVHKIQMLMNVYVGLFVPVLKGDLIYNLYIYICICTLLALQIV